MSIETYLESLEELIDPSQDPLITIESYQAEAITAAADSLAFCKALFDIFKLNGMLDEDATFDLYVLETLIDNMVGEVTAAALYLKGQPPGRKVSEGLRSISNDIHQHNLLAKEEDRVPLAVEVGFSKLAEHVESAKIHLAI